MKKILAFAGSNSSTSINHELVTYAASLFENGEVTVIKLTDYPLPMFGEDIEREVGYSDILKNLLSIIKEHDALMISVNEHNGNLSAFFKNVLDWLSRIEYKFLKSKPVLLMSTSNGKRGAKTSLGHTEAILPRFDAESIITFVFPSFSENFSEGKITHPDFKEQLISQVKHFENSL